MGAIASGDAKALGVVLEGLRSNASALKGAISLDEESLSRTEIETLLTMSVAWMQRAAALIRSWFKLYVKWSPACCAKWAIFRSSRACANNEEIN